MSTFRFSLKSFSRLMKSLSNLQPSTALQPSVDDVSLSMASDHSLPQRNRSISFRDTRKSSTEPQKNVIMKFRISSADRAILTIKCGCIYHEEIFEFRAIRRERNLGKNEPWSPRFQTMLYRMAIVVF